MIRFRLQECPHMTRSFEDWSRVRSPSRAARRRRLGHPQRIEHRTVASEDVYVVDGTLVGHPDTLARITAHLPLRP